MNARLFAAALALVGLSGCYSKITAYDGRFTIGYASPLQSVENFVKPIAPGAKLDVVVFANGTVDKLTLVSATSSKPGVLAVDAVKDQLLTLRGLSTGVADITVTAKDADGKELTDRMFFHVAKPATHGLEHACTDEPSAIYVRGATVDVFHSLSTADKRPVIGYGFVPVAIEPAGALELTAQPQAGTLYRYRADTARSSITVRSLVDDKALTLRVVEPTELKAAQLYAGERMLVGQRSYVFAHVELGATPVCSQNALTHARSLTPEICTVTARLDDSLDDSNREQLAEVTALKYGTCKLEVTLPELAGGKGIVLKHTVQVGRVEYPSAAAETVTRYATWAWLLFAEAVGLTLLYRARRRR